MAIPVIVLGEYRHGIAQSRNRATYENWLTALLSDCFVLDINEPTTHCYADIILELVGKGKPIPTHDLWIAALCRQHSLPLLSRDRHFDQVSGIKRIGVGHGDETCIGGGRLRLPRERGPGAGAGIHRSFEKEKATLFSQRGLYLCRQRPTLPHTFACSTIGPAGLNFRVRDGNGWIPRGMITDFDSSFQL